MRADFATGRRISEYARKKAGWLKAPEHDDTPESVKEHINEIYSKLGLDRKLCSSSLVLTSMPSFTNVGSYASVRGRSHNPDSSANAYASSALLQLMSYHPMCETDLPIRGCA